MAHEYSVQVHDWIKQKMAEAASELKKAEQEADPVKESYSKGMLGQLNEIRQYLTDQIDLDTHKYY